jgi:hypothetical protein
MGNEDFRGDALWWADAALFIGAGLPVLILAVFVGVRLAGPGRVTRTGWRAELAAGLIVLVLVALLVFGTRPAPDVYTDVFYFALVPLSGIVGGLTACRVTRPVLGR